MLARDRTLALLAIAVEVIGRYAAKKDQRGLLDYDDLIATPATARTAWNRPGCTTSSTSASTIC